MYCQRGSSWRLNPWPSKSVASFPGLPPIFGITGLGASAKSGVAPRPVIQKSGVSLGTRLLNLYESKRPYRNSVLSNIICTDSVVTRSTCSLYVETLLQHSVTTFEGNRIVTRDQEIGHFVESRDQALSD